jgi:hypothetical protein
MPGPPPIWGHDGADDSGGRSRGGGTGWGGGGGGISHQDPPPSTDWKTQIEKRMQLLRDAVRTENFTSFKAAKNAGDVSRSGSYGASDNGSDSLRSHLVDATQRNKTEAENWRDGAKQGGSGSTSDWQKRLKKKKEEVKKNIDGQLDSTLTSALNDIDRNTPSGQQSSTASGFVQGIDELGACIGDTIYQLTYAADCAAGRGSVHLSYLDSAVEAVSARVDGAVDSINDLYNYTPSKWDFGSPHHVPPFYDNGSFLVRRSKELKEGNDLSGTPATPRIVEKQLLNRIYRALDDAGDGLVDWQRARGPAASSDAVLDAADNTWETLQAMKDEITSKIQAVGIDQHVKDILQPLLAKGPSRVRTNLGLGVKGWYS